MLVEHTHDISIEEGEHTLIVAFGSMDARFEFRGLTEGLPCAKMYIRDPNQAWYHGPFKTISENIDGLARYIQGNVDKYDRAIALGSSGGAYAALLFGFLCKMDTVHAFAPQTTLSRRDLTEIGDNRWEIYGNIYSQPSTQKKYYDLSNILTLNEKTEFNIYYSQHEQFDVFHALRMHGVPRVRFHASKKGGHCVAAYYKATGKLKEIIGKEIIWKD